MMLNISEILGQSLVETGLTLIAFLPRIVIAMVIFAIGWAAALVLERAVAHLVTVLRIDRALNKAGMEKLSERAGVKLSLAAFLGGVVKWLVIVAFTIASAEVLSLTQITQLLRDVLVYIPNVIVAAVIMIIATLLADFIARLISHSVKATGMQAGFAVPLARWAIIIVGGVFPALTQLRIINGLIEVLFTGVVFAVSLAAGLAFGLGGKEAAARVLEKLK